MGNKKKDRCKKKELAGAESRRSHSSGWKDPK